MPTENLRVRLVALARRPLSAAPPAEAPETWQKTCDAIAAEGRVYLSPRVCVLLWEVVRHYRDYADDEAHLPGLVEGRRLIQAIASTAKKLREQLNTLDSGTPDLLEPLLRSYMWPDPLECRENEWRKPQRLDSLIERHLHGDLLASKTLRDLPILLRQLAESCDSMNEDLEPPKKGRPRYPGFDAFVSRLAAIYLGRGYGDRGGRVAAHYSDITGQRNSPFVRFCRAVAKEVSWPKGVNRPAPGLPAFGKAIDNVLQTKGIDWSDGTTRWIAKELHINKTLALAFLPPSARRRALAKNPKQP